MSHPKVVLSLASIRIWVALSVVLMLTGCSTGSPLATAKDLVLYAWNPSIRVEQAQLDSRFAYVRVEHEGRFSVLALAYEETVGPAQVRRQVFVSGSKETLTIEHGVIQGFSSLTRQWVVQGGQVLAQPGYAVMPKMPISHGPLPPQSIQSKVFFPASAGAIRATWQGIPGGWAAFHASNGSGSASGTWLFTYQCLQKDFCLAVQAWSSSLQEQLRAGR